MPISYSQLEDVAYELNRRAAIAVPLDAKKAFVEAAQRETHPDAKRALLAVIDNADVAVGQQSSMCGDTGLPRFYVKSGNDVRLEGGFVALERALRAATARATKDVPLRSNRVHPLTRRNPGTNVGVMAPNIEYRFEPEGDWIDLTAVHKGGLFGSDYRWSVLGAGRNQLPIAAMAAAMGGNVRVGLEDSLWAGPGRLAESNAEQVRLARQIVEGLGLEIASAEEAREMLQLKGGHQVAF